MHRKKLLWAKKLKVLELEWKLRVLESMVVELGWKSMLLGCTDSHIGRSFEGIHRSIGHLHCHKLEHNLHCYANCLVHLVPNWCR